MEIQPTPTATLENSELVSFFLLFLKIRNAWFEYVRQFRIIYGGYCKLLGGKNWVMIFQRSSSWAYHLEILLSGPSFALDLLLSLVVCVKTVWASVYQQCVTCVFFFYYCSLLLNLVVTPVAVTSEGSGRGGHCQQDGSWTSTPSHQQRTSRSSFAKAIRCKHISWNDVITKWREITFGKDFYLNLNLIKDWKIALNRGVGVNLMHIV